MGTLPLHLRRQWLGPAVMERIKDLDAWSKKAKAQWNAMMAEEPTSCPKEEGLVPHIHRSGAEVAPTD